MYEGKTKFYMKLRGNNLENHLILRRIKIIDKQNRNENKSREQNAI